jgi:hypothetical protein
MKPIQIILIALLGGLALAVWLNRGSAKLLNRLIVAALALLGSLMVLAPDTTTVLAEAVGVGRGTDLLVYLAVIGFALGVILLYARLRQLEVALTEVVRAQAIQNARAPSGKGEAFADTGTRSETDVSADAAPLQNRS